MYKAVTFLVCLHFASGQFLLSDTKCNNLKEFLSSENSLSLYENKYYDTLSMEVDSVLIDYSILPSVSSNTSCEKYISKQINRIAKFGFINSLAIAYYGECVNRNQKQEFVSQLASQRIEITILFFVIIIVIAIGIILFILYQVKSTVSRV